jgi:hypothetical protein
VTAAQLLRTLRVVPFQRFVIHLVDGRNIEIRHPEIVKLAGGGRIALVETTPGLEEAIDVLMIVSLRPTEERA